MSTKREAQVKRKTTETNIQLTWDLDGTGKAQIQTGIAFLDHMLQLFALHGLFDLKITARGDLDVDYHHTVEDVGICLGTAFKEALGSGQGITRYASGLIPMDESLCQMAIDISNRPYFSFSNPFACEKVGGFDLELIKEFFIAFVNNAKITLHISILSGENSHHIAESCFKAFGVLLDEATQLDKRKKRIPSTKGVL